MVRSPKVGSMTLGAIKFVMGTLIGGVALFAAVAIAVKRPSAVSFSLAGSGALWLMIAAAVSVSLAVAVAILSRLLVAKTRSRFGREASEEAILAEYATYTIIRSALIESGGLLGVALFFAIGTGAGLVLAILSVLGLTIVFPTASRLQGFRELVTRPV